MEFHQKTFWICGSLLAMLAIVAGAFGSHYLKNKLSIENLNIFEVAVRYQMYHALALIGLAIALRIFPSSLLITAGWLFIVGTVIFSGSLYLLILTGVKKWGAVTPIGGVLLVIGWFLSLLGGL
ncbi:MAG: DUF423 domain-containing protein [Parachlamydiaceae bacterium]|nr:DUF423 domain-containing protein [Parachlamydiaceae bacterium]